MSEQWHSSPHGYCVPVELGAAWLLRSKCTNLYAHMYSLQFLGIALCEKMQSVLLRGWGSSSRQNMQAWAVTPGLESQNGAAGSWEDFRIVAKGRGDMWPAPLTTGLMLNQQDDTAHRTALMRFRTAALVPDIGTCYFIVFIVLAKGD